MKSFRLLLLPLFLVVSYISFGEYHDDYGQDYMTKGMKFHKFKEQSVKIPFYPNPKNYIPLEIPYAHVKYFIDAKSVSVGKKDRVARYTVIIRSRSGANNVYFEGIRCDSKQYRTYAYYNNADKKPKLMLNSQWQTIQGVSSYKYRKVLYDMFVCNDSAVRPKAKDIIQVLKYPPSYDPAYNPDTE